MTFQSSEETQFTLKEQNTMTGLEAKWAELLKDILGTLNTIPRAKVPAQYRGNVKYEDTYQICAAIEKAIDWQNM